MATLYVLRSLQSLFDSSPVLTTKPTPRKKVSRKVSPQAESSRSPTKVEPSRSPAKAEPSSSSPKAEPSRATRPAAVAASPPQSSIEERTTVVAKASSSMPSMETVISSEAELYLWDGKDAVFVHQGVVTASIVLRANSAYEYWLTATRDAVYLLAHKVSEDMNQRFSHKMSTLTWNHLGEDGSQNSWLFKFRPDDYAIFLQKFVECSWESLHKTPWAKAKVSVHFGG